MGESVIVKSTCNFCGSSNEFHGAANAYSCHCNACGKNCAGEFYHERVINRVPDDLISKVTTRHNPYLVGGVIGAIIYFIAQFL